MKQQKVKFQHADNKMDPLKPLSDSDHGKVDDEDESAKIVTVSTVVSPSENQPNVNVTPVHTTQSSTSFSTSSPDANTKVNRESNAFYILCVI